MVLTALLCIWEIEKSIFWTKRAYVHKPVTLESGMNHNLVKYKL